VAIPDYQSLMLPVLKLAGDGREHRMSDVVDTLATQLNLTESEREELLPSGKQPVFNNRVHWAKTYLVSCSSPPDAPFLRSQNAVAPSWQKTSNVSTPSF
jgi:restriction endonuclease Mrr